MQDIIKLCYEERLVLMADEVYQSNVYKEAQPSLLVDVGLVHFVGHED
jgi:aspartate/methionine/tyrosine aminotransferase